MPNLSSNLILKKCPHCGIDNPNLRKRSDFVTSDHEGKNKRYWYVYACGRCGGVVNAAAKQKGKEVIEYYPTLTKVDESLPKKAKEFLQQANNTVHAPAGSIMLCASSVDSMLKEKGYKKGSLYNRINEAADDHLITEDMKNWAHEIRLDANDQRHADENAMLPKIEDAKRTLDFTTALGEYLFVLPAKVNQGMEDVK